MNELLVKLDFNVDKIFDEEFQVGLNSMLRSVVLNELEKLVRETTVKIYKDHELDVSAAVLDKYKQEHAKFQASIDEGKITNLEVHGGNFTDEEVMKL